MLSGFKVLHVTESPIVKVYCPFPKLCGYNDQILQPCHHMAPHHNLPFHYILENLSTGETSCQTIDEIHAITLPMCYQQMSV